MQLTVQAQHSGAINGNQPGDPQKLAEVLSATYESGNAPLHLFLGSDSVSMAEQRLPKFKARSPSTVPSAYRQISESSLFEAQ